MRLLSAPRRFHRTLVSACTALGLCAASAAHAFDLDRGHAPIDVVIPTVIPVIFANVGPGDATLVLRTTTLVTNAMFDAIAPYHPTAVGVYSKLPRRPASEGATERQRNTAIFYACQELLNSLYPAEKARWADMLRTAGLDPAAQSTDLRTAVGIGRAAGKALVAARENDGMNQMGNAQGQRFNKLPYADTTGYQPVNTAYELRNPARWQPAITTRGNGLFQVQQFVTPQFGQVKPYSYGSAEQFNFPAPVDSNPFGPGGRARYKAQVDQILNASATLTDQRKMVAELFNDKIRSLGFVALFLSQSRQWSVEQFVHYDFLVNMAAFDGGIAVWHAKRKFDAVRPFSAVNWVHGKGMVTAWGGPGKGTVNLPADQWASYVKVADHPEYPSGSSCFCSAHAQASRRFLGSDMLGWRVAAPKGSSLVEPGVTPATDIVLQFDTWSQFEQQCGQSRLWGGVHFQPAIDASKPVCKAIGDKAYQYVQNLIDGRG